MAVVVPLDHKQIAYVSYIPEERSLIVTYHRGEQRCQRAVDPKQFETLINAINKVDELSRLLVSQDGTRHDNVVKL
jgi:hypothetical protein